jgi:hypothetical protein
LDWSLRIATDRYLIWRGSLWFSTVKDFSGGFTLSFLAGDVCEPSTGHLEKPLIMSDFGKILAS